MYFTKAWLKGRNGDVTPSTSRQSRGEQEIWQRRFYGHTCRDEEDLKPLRRLHPRQSAEARLCEPRCRLALELISSVRASW